MKYYSTQQQAPLASLREAVIRGLAPDKGLYMPQSIKTLASSFYEGIDQMSLPEIGLHVAQALFGEDVPADVLHRIVYETLNFEIPAREVSPHIYALELFHGPTLAFKDVGARFMARLLGHFIQSDASHRRPVNVLVATSGDTGSAVANGFLGVEGIHVYVLYPEGKVSPLQEMQFATLGRNITAIAVDGTFDDCQAMVKNAFMDHELQSLMRLTSANSINLARLLPQSFYYFHAYAQMKRMGLADKLVVSVPSGNFGNIAAGLVGWRMGLPIRRFVAANNRNAVFHDYLQSGRYNPRPSVATIANAMDVGAPSNFDRIVDLFNHSHETMTRLVSGTTYTDDEIKASIVEVHGRYDYLLDPHGACGYRALSQQLQPGETGLFLATAHPAKFRETMASIIGQPIEVPATLQAFMNGRKQNVRLGKDFQVLKEYLLGQC